MHEDDDLRALVLNYVRSHRDVTVELAMSDLSLERADVPRLRRILDRLATEGHILKSYCAHHDCWEYDPADSDEVQS